MILCAQGPAGMMKACPSLWPPPGASTHAGVHTTGSSRSRAPSEGVVATDSHDIVSSKPKHPVLTFDWSLPCKPSGESTSALSASTQARSAEWKAERRQQARQQQPQRQDAQMQPSVGLRGMISSATFGGDENDNGTGMQRHHSRAQRGGSSRASKGMHAHNDKHSPAERQESASRGSARLGGEPEPRRPRHPHEPQRLGELEAKLGREALADLEALLPGGDDEGLDHEALGRGLHRLGVGPDSVVSLRQHRLRVRRLHAGELETRLICVRVGSGAPARSSERLQFSRGSSPTTGEHLELQFVHTQSPTVIWGPCTRAQPLGKYARGTLLVSPLAQERLQRPNLKPLSVQATTKNNNEWREYVGGRRPFDSGAHASRANCCKDQRKGARRSSYTCRRQPTRMNLTSRMSGFDSS